MRLDRCLTLTRIISNQTDSRESKTIHHCRVPGASRRSRSTGAVSVGPQGLRGRPSIAMNGISVRLRMSRAEWTYSDVGAQDIDLPMETRDLEGVAPS